MDKKGIASLLIESTPEETNEVENEQEEVSGEDMALDEFIDALERKDKVAAKEALKNFIELCTSGEDEE